MKGINLYVLMILGFLFFACQNQKETNPLMERTELQLDSLLANPEIESVSLGIIDGEEVYLFHKGSLLNKTKPTDETLYEIASLTKTFTGTLVAQAIVEEKILIDDDIRKYLTEDLSNLAYENRPITFHHLLTHQSGLPNMFPNKKYLFNNPDWDKLPFIINELQKDFSREDFFSELAKIKLDTIPGLNFSYSNCGANLIGYLLEEIYNKSYEELLEDKILIPLKMHTTQITKDEVELKKLAYGQNSNKIRMPMRVNKGMNAEGGIVSSTEDMLKYLRFHLDETNEIVRKSHQHLWNGKYGDFDVGFFWQISKDGENPDRIFQNGGAFGTSSWVTLIPESSIGIFIATNVAGQNVHQKLSEVVDKIVKEIQDNRL